MEKKHILIDKPETRNLSVALDKDGMSEDIFVVINARSSGDYVLNILTDHMAKNTFGRVEVRGVVENGARVRVDGMVKIEKGAVKSDSFLSMKILVLDDISSAIAEPQLEIENNDVKASHSASVGKIDEEQLFYLESRGVDKNEAKKLIVDGFLGEVRNESKNV
jgi:Fe-S cluster assembly scaffold protein SufB